MTLTVVKPGMLTTVQDLGRRGYQSRGVPVSGPMDVHSHRLANAAVGNDAMAAALEITLLGPELLADGDLVCAVAGAEIEVTVEGARVAPNAPLLHWQKWKLCDPKQFTTSIAHPICSSSWAAGSTMRQVATMYSGNTNASPR